MTVFLIAIFAFLGGILRYVLGMLPTFASGFPIGTLVANYLGCFLLTWLVKGLLRNRGMKPMVIVGLATGFCGGLTTFSTFAVDTVRLLIEDKVVLAVVYLIFSVVGGLFFSWLGDALSTREAS